MSSVEKIAVSLPVVEAERLKAFAKRIKVPRSAVVRQALRVFFIKGGEDLIREQYARYYAGEKQREEDLKLAHAMSALSRKSWPRSSP
ncbi:MAG: hypothetical protein HYZ73_06975 [Elusimicrobia bacterium]|nr:hypothetical protein [Elusimicrobiota bacterium]